MSLLLFDRFEGGADEATWTNTSVGAGCSISYIASASVPGGPHMGWGEDSIRMIRAGTGWDCRKWVNLAATPAYTAWYVHVELLVDSEGLSNTQQLVLFRLVESDNVTVPADVLLRQDASGNLVLRYRAVEDGSTFSSYDSATISLDTVYSIDLYYDIGNSLHECRVDGTQIGSATSITSNATDLERLMLGSGPGDLQVATTVYYDRVSIGDSRWHHLRGGPNRGRVHIFLDGAAEDIGPSYEVGSGRIQKNVGITPDELTMELWPAGNRITESEDISAEPPWTDVGLTSRTVASMTEDTSTGFHYIWQIGAGIPVPAGRHLLVSCEGSTRVTGGRDLRMDVVQRGAPGVGAGGVFDFTSVANTISYSSAVELGGGQVINAGVLMKSLGTYRCWVVVQLPSNVDSVAVRLFMSQGATISYTGSGVHVLDLWKVQLETARTVSTDHYVPTAESPSPGVPVARQPIELQIAWTESDGAVYYDAAAAGESGETVFQGHVVRNTQTETGPDNLGLAPVRALGYAWDAARERYTYVTAEEDAELSMKEVVDDNITGDGYTATGNATMPDVASREYVQRTVPEIVEDIARRAGRIWRVMPDKNFEMWAPGDRVTVVEFDRDLGMHLLANPEWSARVDELANRVRVTGRDGIFVVRQDTASQTEYGIHDHEPLEFSDIISETDLEQIGDAVVDSFKAPILDGQGLRSYWHRIEPGDETYYTDRVKGLVRETIWIRSVVMEQNEGEVWEQSIDITTQPLVDLVTPIAERRRATIIEEDDKIIIESPNTISSPNSADPTVAANTFQIHFRYDSAGPTWRMELVNGDHTPNLISVVAFSIVVPGRTAQSITATAEDVSGEGKDLIVLNNNTQRIVVQQGNDDATPRRVWWQVGDNSQDTVALTWADATVLAQGIVQILIGPGNPQLTEIARITYGAETLAAKLGTAKMIEVRLPLAP